MMIVFFDGIQLSWLKTNKKDRINGSTIYPNSSLSTESSKIACPPIALCKDTVHPF